VKEKIEFSTIPGGVTYRRPFIERLAKLGWGADVDRARAEQVCGTASAANQFLDKASRTGFLVPIAWGTYRVVDVETFEQMKRVPNPAFQRFIAWAKILPTIEPKIAFLAPRLWRDTDLSEEGSLPIVPLTRSEKEAPIFTPQWEALAADVAKPESWDIVIAGDRMATCKVPTAADTAALLRETLDPRWIAAATEIDRRAPKTQRLGAPNRAIVTPAPRAREGRNIGLGLPTLRRIVAPRWYIEARLRGVSEVIADA